MWIYFEVCKERRTDTTFEHIMFTEVADRQANLFRGESGVQVDCFVRQVQVGLIT